jgi:hypothetical protein
MDQKESNGGAPVSGKLEVKIDRKRVRHYFVLVSTACCASVWLLWFMLGFMGSRSSPDGITAADVLRTTLYSLPVAMILSCVFPMVVLGERNRWWAADDRGIDVYLKDSLLVSVEWGEIDDVIFREYSVSIYLRGRTPDEYNVFLPSPKQCDQLSSLYNKSKGIHCEMDEISS